MPNSVNEQITPPSEGRAGWSKTPDEGLGPLRNQPSMMPGMKVKDLPTPALLLDMDTMESNLARMAEFFRNKPTKLRPHFKALQIVDLAHRQIAAGASGLTCARLEHAEMLVDQGFENILIANEIAGTGPLRHFVELSHRAPVIVAVDNASVVEDMAALAGSRAHELNVVVDLDVRLGRCGVPPGEAALSLTKTVLSKGLRFRGLMGYEGHIPLPAGPEKQRVAHMALQRLTDTKALLEGRGIPVEIATCGGTSDYSEAAAFPGVTEVQAGSYLLMDTWYVPHAADFQPTLTVLSTVISKSVGNRLVADAGAKAMSAGNGLPQIKGMPGLKVKALHSEHILMEIQDPSIPVEVGDQIEIWVNTLDPTLRLHNYIFGIRNSEVEVVFPVAR
jgi:D-threonine aldolase